jgi:hypothetical protein
MVDNNITLISAGGDVVVADQVFCHAGWVGGPVVVEQCSSMVNPPRRTSFHTHSCSSHATCTPQLWRRFCGHPTRRQRTAGRAPGEILITPYPSPTLELLAAYIFRRLRTLLPKLKEALARVEETEDRGIRGGLAARWSGK